ncbi:hypothetical protein CDAR_120741 [Caerostris darwini]|uniref:Uncharacterized protein n=1 Tax=Caerostris darwini TaxID=1538125 RepID=A0AAV4RUU5_9ARAC|nr:hypothetical protein CDAR_120741 [Caerostris darwini]
MVSGGWLDKAALDATRRCISRYRIPFGIKHLQMHRLVGSSAALSSNPPLTTTSLNPRQNCPPPSGRLSSCPTPANPGQPTANLLPLKLPFLSPRASVEAPNLMNHLN